MEGSHERGVGAAKHNLQGALHRHVTLHDATQVEQEVGHQLPQHKVVPGLLHCLHILGTPVQTCHVSVPRHRCAPRRSSEGNVNQGGRFLLHKWMTECVVDCELMRGRQNDMCDTLISSKRKKQKRERECERGRQSRPLLYTHVCDLVQGGGQLLYRGIGVPQSQGAQDNKVGKTCTKHDNPGMLATTPPHYEDRRGTRRKGRNACSRKWKISPSMGS